MYEPGKDGTEEGRLARAEMPQAGPLQKEAAAGAQPPATGTGQAQGEAAAAPAQPAMPPAASYFTGERVAGPSGAEGPPARRDETECPPHVPAAWAAPAAGAAGHGEAGGKLPGGGSGPDGVQAGEATGAAGVPVAGAEGGAAGLGRPQAGPVYLPGGEGCAPAQDGMPGGTAGAPLYSQGAEAPHWMPPNAAPAERPKKKKRRGLKMAALLLACALFGFGGGAASVALLGQRGGTTVVYQAPTTAANPTGVLSDQPASVSDVAEIAGKSSVSILAESLDSSAEDGILAGAGSGVVLSEDGYILTNHHVISGAQVILVTLPDGREYPAEVAGSDARSDIALLKIEADGLTPATLGNSDDLRVGDFSMAIGNPQGILGGSVSTGIISALGRYITIGNYTMKLLQTSAPVSPGNSGGGLFNANGELVGIVNAKSGGENTEGLGFAIPINDAMDVVEQLLDKGYVSGRPGMGVTLMTVRTELEAQQADVDGPGLYIVEVAPGGAADKAGLKAGDRIVAMEGDEVNNFEDLRAGLENREVGEEIALEILRDGRARTVYLILEELGD